MVFTSLVKLHPTKFHSLSEIMYLHLRHFYFFLFRLKIPAKFNKQNNYFILNKKNVRLCITWTGLNWLHIIWSIFLFLQFLPEYGFLCSKGFGIANYSRFSLMMTSAFILMEHICYTQVKEMIPTENKTLSLIKEYLDKLDTDLARKQINYLLNFFNKKYPLLKIYITLVFSSLSSFFFLLAYQFAKSYFTYNIKLWRLPIYILVAAWSNFQGIVIHIFGITISLHLYFIIKIFKFKLANCEEWLKQYSVSENRLYFNKFNQTYITLHRSLNMYNVFCSKFTYMCDLALKLSGSITFSVFYLEGNFQKNQLAMGIAGLFVVSYIAIQLVYTIFAYFPEKNLAIYKSVSSINAIHFCAFNNLKKVKDQNSTLYKKNLRHFMRVNSMVQMLAVNQTFGFTYSSYFLILKKTVVDKIFSNFYFLLLFVKKFA